MRKDNDLLRSAMDTSIRSIDRRHSWRARWQAIFGVSPEKDPSRRAARAIWHLHCIRQNLRTCTTQQRHGNSTVVKFPRRHRQIMGASLPTPPEVA